MNRKRRENELSVIAKNIFEYQFKRKTLEIRNPDAKENLTYAEWEERCKELFYTFFTRDGESSGIILFPDTEITISQTLEVKKYQRVMSTLNAWCKTSSLNDATGLIIRNYNLEDHIYFCGISKDEIRDTLAFEDSKNMFSFQNSDQRFLAFNPSLKIIFIIRLVDLVQGESELLRKEVGYCIDEVNLLCLLLKNELADTGVIVTGLVAYSGENAHSQSACKDCGNFIVSFKIFNSVETFKGFWETFVIEKNFEKIAVRLAGSKKKDKVSIFQAVASKILGFLAHLQFLILEEPILPVKEKRPADDIEQAELLLDRYQMKIAYSDDNRVWLDGNYGTGKTVVALKKLELLCKGLKDKEVIYYVNFAQKSSLDFLIKHRFKKYGNVKVVKGGISLSNTINFQILPEERELGTKNVHLIIDEYGLEYLSIEEAKVLGQVLTKEEKFINSQVLIAAQPIEMKRVDNFYDGEIKKQFSQKKHELHKLIRMMGMKKKMLSYAMRTTVEINTLTEITQAYLNHQSNKYVRQQRDINFNLPEIEESGFQSTLSELPQSSRSKLTSPVSTVLSDSSKIPRKTPPFRSQEVTYNGLDKKKSNKIKFDSSIDGTSRKQSSFLFQNASPKSSFSESVKSNDLSNPVASSAPFPSRTIPSDYYQLHKLIPAAAKPTYSEDIGSYQETVTEFQFTCDSLIGHGIKGPLPKLIKLESACNDSHQIALIASVLKKVMPAERTAVIHFETDDPPLWLKILFQLTDRLTMTTVTEEFLRYKRKNLVLVKNLNFLRGLEFSDVLLILDSNEHHLRQFIPEAITRCKSNLSILIRPSLSAQSNTVADLVHKWEQDKSVIDIVKVGYGGELACNNNRYHLSTYCSDEKESFYKVHRNNKKYRKFLIEINLAYNENMQPDHAKKLEEAKAL